GGNYGDMLEQVCGGAPGEDRTDREYRSRSPLSELPAAKAIPIDINADIHDGDTGSVPINHSLRAFNVLAAANGFPEQQIADEQIAYMTEHEKVPAECVHPREDDPERALPVLFRRTAGPVRVTIFEGGHESEPDAGLN